MEHEYKDIKLNQIAANPQNYRQDFSGSDFDEFVESIRQKGVVQPILVRPKKAKGKNYEIVFGERRFRAAGIVAKGKGAKKTIPAMVKELSDGEAYDLMVIENIQRKGLSELEEARGFRRYLDKNGDAALADLAERTGINPAYIRRRVAVLGLPEPVLTAWGQGDLKYGYLEQLTRLEDENEIMGFFEIIQEGYQIERVKDLKRLIDNQSVELRHALFDLEKEGCLACHSNSDIQLVLFEIDVERTKCSKPACFKKKQSGWLSENWKGSTYRKKFKTTGAMFTDDIDRNQCNLFGYDKKAARPCFKCSAFITLFYGPKMNVHIDRLCIGEPACFNKTTAKPKKDKPLPPENAGAGQGDQPRVAWHGEHFREIFYQEAIPDSFKSVTPGQLQAVQLSLFALLRSNWELTYWFKKEYAEDAHAHSPKQLFKPIAAMNLQQANEALKAATLQTIMFDDFLAEARRIAADHIGIDLLKQWTLTEDYLNKKTIGEMLGMGKRFGIFSDAKAKKYLADTVKKKKFKACKKTELINIFLKTGVDLSGCVPDEIIN